VSFNITTNLAVKNFENRFDEVMNISYLMAYFS